MSARDTSREDNDRSRAAQSPATANGAPTTSRFSPALLYEAARLYWVEDSTQAQIAETLGTSRPTVSRLLADARSHGIVEIRVRKPNEAGLGALADALIDRLGLRAAQVTPSTRGMPLGRALGPAVAQALTEAELSRGDALLISSGATLYAVAQEQMPPMPGVLVAPTVGGQHEIESEYQTNEITRRFALKVGGTPVLLHAPALPGPDLRRLLIQDPSVQQVLQLWGSATCALLGVGAAPLGRTSLPRMLPTDPVTLRGAVGDICVRPYDESGDPIEFAGSDQLIAMELETLPTVPHTIAVAVGEDKINAITVGARAGYFNTLITDEDTATALLRT